MSKLIGNFILRSTKHDAKRINSDSTATRLMAVLDGFKVLRIPKKFKQIDKTIPYYDVEHRCKGELRQLKT